MEVLGNTNMVMILQYLSVSKEYVVHFFLTLKRTRFIIYIIIIIISRSWKLHRTSAGHTARLQIEREEVIVHIKLT